MSLPNPAKNASDHDVQTILFGLLADGSGEAKSEARRDGPAAVRSVETVDSLQPWFVTCHGLGETTRRPRAAKRRCIGLRMASKARFIAGRLLIASVVRSAVRSVETVDSLQPWFVTCHGLGETTRQGTKCFALPCHGDSQGTEETEGREATLHRAQDGFESALHRGTSGSSLATAWARRPDRAPNVSRWHAVTANAARRRSAPGFGFAAMRRTVPISDTPICPRESFWKCRCPTLEGRSECPKSGRSSASLQIRSPARWSRGGTLGRDHRGTSSHRVGGSVSKGIAAVPRWP
jgi:hypothetical protein